MRGRSPRRRVRPFSYGESAMALSIEVAQRFSSGCVPTAAARSPACMASSTETDGDGDAYAVYHAMLQSDHPSTVVDLALCFGSWAEETTAADRTRVGVRVWPDGDQLKMHVNDVRESAWGDSERLGKMARREEVLGTPLEEEALRARRGRHWWRSGTARRGRRSGPRRSGDGAVRAGRSPGRDPPSRRASRPCGSSAPGAHGDAARTSSPNVDSSPA